jgi:hypothetical protein
MTVTLTYDGTLSRVAISANGLAPATVATVQRSRDQVRWTTVRGGVDVPVTAGGALASTLYDYEFAPNVVNYYRTVTTTALDTYTRTIASGLGTTDTGQPYTLVGTAANFAVNGTQARITPSALASRRIGLLDTGSADHEIKFDGAVAALPASGNWEVNAILRWSNANNFYAGGWLVATTGAISYVLNRSVAGVVTTVIFAASGQTYVAGTNLSMRAKILGSTISVKIWASAGAEPGPYSFSYTDPAALVTGTMAGLAASNSTAVVTHTFTYDNLWLQGSGISAVQTASMTPTLDRVWLKSIARPFLNRPIQLGGRDFKTTRRARGSLSEPVDRSLPIALTDVRGSRRYTLTIRTTTADDAQTLDYVLASGDVLYLHAPEGQVVPAGGVYVRVDDTQAHRPGLNDELEWCTVPVVEVAAPGPDVVGAVSTWQTVLNSYATWADLLAANATWADLLARIAPPSEVIVP